MSCTEAVMEFRLIFIPIDHKEYYLVETSHKSDGFIACDSFDIPIVASCALLSHETRQTRAN